MAQKADIAELIDIFEMGKYRDFTTTGIVYEGKRGGRDQAAKVAGVLLDVAIPLKSAGSSGVILPPVYFMLVAARESTQPAGMAQAADCSRWPLMDRIDIPESEILIACGTMRSHTASAMVGSPMISNH